MLTCLQMVGTHAQHLPIFWGHGTSDPIVKFERAKQSIEFLKSEIGVLDASAESRIGLEFHPYPGLVHSSNDEEIGALKVWLEKVLPQKDE